ncbi:MAG: hypothetical protein IJL51_06475 [Oscillospiraceae bacterium]|nr:hypothetical protein [Oscillospiraceae bacterium]
MKKIIPLLLALLLLGACARAPQPETVPDPTEAPELTAAPAPTADSGKTEEEMDDMNKETVTLDGRDSYLRLTLPEGWDWTEGETVEDRSSLILTPRTNDGFRVELVWWGFFGMCGTGVDFSEYTLPDGRTATLAVDKSGDQVWWTLILPDSPDQFTIQFGAPQSVIDAHQAEIDAMLESLQLGALSHIPPQPTTPLVDK